LIQSPRNTPTTMATSANPTSARPKPTRSVMARARVRSAPPGTWTYISGGDLVRLVLEQAFESLPPLLAGLS
jgi:hypothetical protein